MKMARGVFGAFRTFLANPLSAFTLCVTAIANLAILAGGANALGLLEKDEKKNMPGVFSSGGAAGVFARSLEFLLRASAQNVLIAPTALGRSIFSGGEKKFKNYPPVKSVPTIYQYNPKDKIKKRFKGTLPTGHPYNLHPTVQLQSGVVSHGAVPT